MSDWQQHQGFYNPEASGYYGNYDQGPSGAGVSFMTPAPLGSSFDDGGGFNGDDEFENEPPLLEELGVNPDYIVQKTLTVLNPFRGTRVDVAADSDLAGPLVNQRWLTLLFH